ncbi:MAG: hypothetical protein AB1714_05555 [Acidobacteriota bacterium]
MISIDASVFIIIAVIVFLVFALNRLFFRPVLRTMEARDQQITGRQQEASRMLEEHAKQFAAFQAELGKARRQAGDFKARERSEAQRMGSDEIGSAQRAAHQRLEQQLVSLDQQKSRARADLSAHIAKLAQTIAGYFVR